MRIVFMGTPDYSVKTLESLILAGHEVSAVFSQPDKPVGRKQILTSPPVKEFAVKHGIPVFQPNSLKDGTAFEILKNFSPDIIVVVAYGKILPKEILTLPKYGCVNGHASLLPKYRGASPIQWAIVNGEKYTGVTVMQMDEGMDTGDILSTSKTQIGDNETGEELFERLSIISADLMVETLSDIEKGTSVAIKQPLDGVSYAPIIKKEMAQLDFHKTAEELFNQIRGFNSWPGAFFYIDGKRIKVHSSELDVPKDAVPGEILSNNNELCIACGKGTVLRLLTIQPEGSRVMTVQQFLCGKKIDIGTIIS